MAKGEKKTGKALAIPIPGPGRKSKYREEFADQAFKLTLLGATDEEMANFFEINVATLYRWQNAHPAFCEAIRAGKVKADAEVAHSLYQRATGLHTVEEQLIKKPNGQMEAMRVKKYYPGDPQAALRWLHNRRAKDWREKQVIEHQGGISVSLNSDDEEL